MLLNFLSTMKKMFQNEAPTPDQQRLDRMAMTLGLMDKAEAAPLKGLTLSWGLGYAAVAILIVSLMIVDAGTNTSLLPGDGNGNQAVLNTTNDDALADAYAGDYEGSSLLALVDEADVEAMLMNLSGDNVKQAVDEWGSILPPHDN